MKIATLVGFILAATALSSCACWTDQAKMNTPACIVAHDIVDCTTSAVESALPYFANIIFSLIGGGMDPNNIPWDGIVTQAEAMGIKDGGCFLAELKNLIFGHPAYSQAYAASRKAVDDALTAYKVKHFGSAAVKFKIKDKSGKEVTL